MNPFIDFHAAPPDLLAHAVVLAVLGPLVAACAAAVAPGSRWAWIIAVGASAFSFWMSLGAAGEVARQSALHGKLEIVLRRDRGEVSREVGIGSDVPVHRAPPAACDLTL